MKLQDYRRQYTLGGLSRDKLPADPLELFQQWQAEANAAGLADPTGVVLATQQPDGQLRQRFVLLKGCDDRVSYSSPITTVTKRRRWIGVGRCHCCFRGMNSIDRSAFQEQLKAANGESNAYFARDLERVSCRLGPLIKVSPLQVEHRWKHSSMR